MTSATLRAVLRWALIVVALSACAKKKEDRAPAAVEAKEPAKPEPTPVTEAPKLEQGERSREDEAKEAMRNGGGLGPSAETDAFDTDPTGGEGSDSATKKKTKTGSGSAATTTKGKDNSPIVGGDGTRGAEPTLYAKVGEVFVDGKPAPAALSKALVLSVSEIQACYDKVPNKPTKASGFKLAFSVGSDGVVSSVSVENSTVKNLLIETCVGTVIGRIKMNPPPATEIKATARVSFGPTRT